MGPVATSSRKKAAPKASKSKKGKGREEAQDDEDESEDADDVRAREVPVAEEGVKVFRAGR